uniref:Transcription factor bHLH128-like n=1 Tax=Rhizophora mucronata TaxID=61149 RepID=A0A2P2NH62_RHIMU
MRQKASGGALLAYQRSSTVRNLVQAAGSLQPSALEHGHILIAG